MSFSSQVSDGCERQPKPCGIWTIDFSSPTAKVG